MSLLRVSELLDGFFSFSFSSSSSSSSSLPFSSWRHRSHVQLLDHGTMQKHGSPDNHLTEIYTIQVQRNSDSSRSRAHTWRLSWKLEAWYWAYFAMVVWERLLSHGHVWPVPLGSQFSSAGCCTWVLTSTACSALASTNDLVENSPRSKKTVRGNIRNILLSQIGNRLNKRTVVLIQLHDIFLYN